MFKKKKTNNKQIKDKNQYFFLNQSNNEFSKTRKSLNFNLLINLKIDYSLAWNFFHAYFLIVYFLFIKQ